MRLLDVGCGWGSMRACTPPRTTASRPSASPSRSDRPSWPRKRVAEAGLADRVEIRLQDYRDVDDGPYDAISSIGMFEHVGAAPARRVLPAACTTSCAPAAACSTTASSAPARAGRSRLRPPTSFIDRYVFPDGELHEVGTVVSAMQQAGFEVRHVESLREHYALTLRRGSPTSRRRGTRPSPRSGAGRARVLAPLHGGLGPQLRATAAPGPPGARRSEPDGGAAASRSAPSY